MNATVKKLLILFFAITLVSTAAFEFRVVKANTTVAGGLCPYEEVYDSGKGEIFVTNLFQGTISVVSDTTNSLVASVNVGAVPQGLAYDSAKGEIFVAMGDSDVVSVISDSTNTVVANITVQVDPFGVAYDSAKGEIFVSNQASGTVSVISDSNDSVIATVPVGYDPFDLAYDSGRGEIFAANGGSDSVSVISDSTNTVTGTIYLSGNPHGIIYDSGAGEIFTTLIGCNATSVISDSNNTVVATIPVGATPSGLGYEPAKHEVFVANYGSNSMSIISDNTDTLVATVPIAGNYPIDVVYDSGKNELFVANYLGGSLLVIQDLAAPSTLTSSSAIDQGQTATLTAAPIATGVAPYTFQWLSKEPGNTTFSIVNGATASAYVFNSTGEPLGTWSFELQVSDSTRSTALSNPITVIVNPQLVAPQLSALLSVVDQGQSSTLTCTAITTGTPPYAYQWLSEAPGASFFSVINGATASSYSFMASASTSTGQWNFMLQVTDNANCAVYSSLTSVVVNSAPTVLVSPASSTMETGQSATLKANPSGGSGTYLSYQWYVDGISQIGQTASTFLFASAYSGTYSVTATATDSLGGTSAQSPPVSVNVALGPSADIASSSSPTIDVGQTAQFSVSVSGGTAPYTFQWLSERPGASSYSPVSGATSANYEFAPSTSDVGTWNFIVQVTDGVGASANSTTYSEIVNSPSPTATPTPNNTLTPTVTPQPANSPTAQPAVSPPVPEYQSMTLLIAAIAASTVIIVVLRRNARRQW